MDDGFRIAILVRKDVQDETIQEVFGDSNLAEFQQNYSFTKQEDNYYNNMVSNIMDEMSRLTNNYVQPKIVIIEGDENYTNIVKRDLVEDSTKHYPVTAENFASSFAKISQ